MGEMTFGRKFGLIFGVGLAAAGLVIATVVFPFWNLIRENIDEEVVIMANVDGVCTVDTSDQIPKLIHDCIAEKGDVVNVRYGEGMAWARILP